MPRLHRLNLSRFRNHDALRLNPAGAAVVVLTGANGVGKTNILEAISLLGQGRGLRGADVLEMQSRHYAEDFTQNPWAVSAEAETPQGIVLRIGTGIDQDGLRRVIRLNGRDVKSKAEIAGIVPVVWLTPQMDRLFLDGATPRRRFLDRLVAASLSDHGLRVNRAEKLLRERMKVLQLDRPADSLWLDSLESRLAADSSAIAAARVQFTENLQRQAQALKERESLFPVPLLRVEGRAEERIGTVSALVLEEEIKAGLKQSRPQDAAMGRTAESILRCDLCALYADKSMPAALCSTGEQKGLLISIVLAHAFMMRAEKGYAPLLLLDEVAAHLDAARRQQLFSFLLEAEGQVWLTGTDASMFNPLAEHAWFHAL